MSKRYQNNKSAPQLPISASVIHYVPNYIVLYLYKGSLVLKELRKGGRMTIRKRLFEIIQVIQDTKLSYDLRGILYKGYK